jgi:hypothetical protein
MEKDMTHDPADCLARSMRVVSGLEPEQALSILSGRLLELGLDKDLVADFSPPFLTFRSISPRGDGLLATVEGKMQEPVEDPVVLSDIDGCLWCGASLRG